MRRFAAHRSHSSCARNRGAALLVAMLTVALVATFSAAALWQQWRSIEVESAERERVQSDWILTGALDWARLVLREDARPGSSSVDHLGEPWAVPLQEARLSSFLAADQNNTTVEPGADVFDAFLSGQIVDEQSFLNVKNLVSSGKISDEDFQSFARLFDLLGLPPAQLETLAENLRFASDQSASNGSSALAPLMPQRVEQLVWLGLPANTVAVLQPYITILPSPTATNINLNTASAEVIYAAIHGLTMADAQRLVAVRERAPFRSIGEAKAAVGAPDATFAAGQVKADVKSAFFEVRSRLRLDKLMVEERALVQREGTFVRVLQRVRGAPQPDNGPGASNGPGTANAPGVANGPGATSMGQR